MSLNGIFDDEHWTLNNEYDECSDSVERKLVSENCQK